MNQSFLKTSRNTVLNTVGTFVYFFFQWLTTVLVVRLAGYDVSGTFSLVVSFSNIFSFIARYNIRGYHLCDTGDSFSAEQYAGTYAATAFASLALFVVSLFLCDYDSYTIACAFAYMAFKYCEVFSNFTFSLMQKLDNYAALAVSNCIKGIVPLAGFAAMLWFKTGLLWAIIAMAALYFVSMLAVDTPVIRHAWTFRVSFKGIAALLKICFPLMLASLITPYMTFIVRYIIENLYGSELLGYYSSVSMVVVIMTTLASSVCVVILPSISNSYRAGEYRTIKKMLAVISAAVAGVTLLEAIVGELLGAWAFSLIFGEEIVPYMYLLTPVIVSSGLLTLSTFLMTALIPLGKRVQMLICLCVGAAVLTAVVYPLTKAYALQGANYAMIIGFVAQIAALCVPTALALKQRNEKGQGSK